MLSTPLFGRLWIDVKGRELDATYVGLEGNNVQVRRASNNKIIRIPLKMLSEKDRSYALKSFSDFSETIPLWSGETAKRWWSVYTEPKQWNSEKKKIIDGLRLHWEKDQRIPTGQEESFIGWFNLVRWVSLHKNLKLKDSDMALYIRLSQEDAVISKLLNQLSKQDDIPGAYKVLLSSYKEFPKKLSEYSTLAVAMALVHDKPFPRDWPHHQVRPKDQAPRVDSPATLFRYYVEKNDKRKLAYDLRRLGFIELKNVINHLLPVSELEWAFEKVSPRLETFNKTFSSINYDFPRLGQQAYVWPYENYRLYRILNYGGICVDQAYYAAMSGKAHGIPTLYFSGQGSGGGHAWFGYLKSAGNWDLDCGRYSSQNYPVGDAKDPQTWQVVNSEELEFFSKGEKRQRSMLKSKIELSWARIHRDKDYYHQAIKNAQASMLSYVEPWEEEERWLNKADISNEEKIKFWKRWIYNFKDRIDVMIKGQEGLADVYSEMGDDRLLADLQKDMMRQKRNQRFDLAIGVGADILLDHIDKEKWDVAEVEFQKVVKKFDAKGGGHLWYGLVRPYVTACLEGKQKGQAQRAMGFVQKSMDIQDGSILHGEFIKLEEHIRKDP